MGSVAALGRHLGAASLAGILAGMLVGGLLGRVVMRVAGFTTRPEATGILTENGNRVGEITLVGTLAIVVFVGIIAGIGGGVLFASAEPWLRSRRSKGVVFGILLFAGLGFTVLDPTNRDFQRFGITPLNLVLFAALFVAYGVTVAWLFARIRRFIDGAGPFAMALQIVCWLSALLAGVASAVSFFSFGGLGDLLPALLLAVVVLIPPVVRWRGLPRPVGYAAFGVPVAAGGLRTLDGLRQLLG